MEITKIQDLINEEIKYFENYSKNISLTEKPFNICTKIEVINEFNIIELLKNGLLISSFVIGGFYDGKICKNHHEFMTNRFNGELLQGNYKFASRSVISGYLHKDRAILLYDILKSNENYIVTLSSVENNLPLEYQFSEFTFKDNEPMYKEYNDNVTLIKENNLFFFNRDENYKKLHHIHAAGFIGHFGNYQNRLESIIKYTKNYEKYTDISDYIEIAIMEKQWGHFNEIYSVFLNSIKLV